MTAKKKSNMYEWAQPWNCLGGYCTHDCKYCSTRHMIYLKDSDKYNGCFRIWEKEMTTDLVELSKEKNENGLPIFVVAQNDMFAKEVTDEMINRILARCREFPTLEFVFQSKNPKRFKTHLEQYGMIFPEKSIFGTTIETNRSIADFSKAPKVEDRVGRLAPFGKYFITIEPIMDFDIEILLPMIINSKPDWVNIGADSKNCDLPEPSRDKVMALIAGFKAAKIEVREKTNLERLLNGSVNNKC